MEKTFPIPSQKPENTEEFRERLRKRVAELLDREPERLMAFCYRLDVKEELIAKALKLMVHSESVNTISDAIWERMLKTWEYRQRYRPD